METIRRLLGVILKVVLAMLLFVAVIFAVAPLKFWVYPKITENQYNSLVVGMTLEEVDEIVGERGHHVYTEDNSMLVNGQPTNTFKRESYFYYGAFKENFNIKKDFEYLSERPEINLLFVNGKLVEKRHEGIKF
ncbi:hypothetical protein [Paenibacillus sp. GCM10012303]|uniref:hypothetical protein n=1 Tax=Paenibacillus sp. GCM10012303 TaxID=3317340 RepID=UPI003620034F